MTETGSSRAKAQRPPSSRTKGVRALNVVALVILMIIVAGVTYVIARTVRDNQLQAALTQIQERDVEIQRVTADNLKRQGTIAELQTQIKALEDKLDHVWPSENTYLINANQSLIIANGHLTVGLVGAPTNDSVNININGKTQSVAAGDVIKVNVDASTTCQVRVQSFDMFKAAVNAICGAAKSP